MVRRRIESDIPLIQLVAKLNGTLDLSVGELQCKVSLEDSLELSRILVCDRRERAGRMSRSLGISDEEATKIGNSRKGYWHLLKSQQLHKILNNQFWAKLGLVNLIVIYSEHRQ
ncbi:hypothetical protein JCM15060_21290 [Halanaerobaculum tunisiense]